MEEARYLDNKSLTNAINKVKIHEPFMLNTFFPSNTYETHVADKIDIEIRSNVNNLAQFVAPDADAKLVSERGDRKIQTVTVPRTFEKKTFTAYELQKFKSLGSAYTGTAQERAAASMGIISQEVAALKERIYRRREQMACQALVEGKISYNNDGYNFEIDYGYVANEQLITLAAAKKWSAAGVNPIDSLDEFQLALQQRNGLSADTMIVGREVASLLKKNTDIMKQLDNLNYVAGRLDITTKYGTSGRYIGTLWGLKIYEYVQQYTDVNKTLVDLFPAKNILLVANVAGAFRTHFGPAYRVSESGLVTLTNDITVQSKINDEKTMVTWSIEQKSLPTIHVPEAIISATVI
jgi:predicted DNA-binding protein (UPF0251 family)